MHIDIPKGTIIPGTKELNQEDLVLKEDLKIPIDVKILYEVNDGELSIYESSYDLDKVLSDVLSSLKFDYYFYGEYDNDELLTEGALSTKKRILEILEIKE